jgi:anti-sigma factor RsiW
MGRLHDAVVRKHLDTCPSCMERVADCRSFITDLKAALSEFAAQD